MKEGLDWIRKFIGNPGDKVNKARLFDNEVKIEGQLLAPKIVNVLVEFERKMEAVLAEMRKFLPRLQPGTVPIVNSIPKGSSSKEISRFYRKHEQGAGGAKDSAAAFSW